MSGRNLARRELLASLYHEGRTFREIAEIYGGTPKGIRGNIRRLRTWGVLPDRQRVGNRWLVL